MAIVSVKAEFYSVALDAQIYFSCISFLVNSLLCGCDFKIRSLNVVINRFTLVAITMITVAKKRILL